MQETVLIEPKKKEISELKEDLIFSGKRLENISKALPEKLNEIKTTDSAGEDEQNISEIIDGLKNRFIQYAKDLESPFKIAVVGSQGTGKSTIVNLLLGESLMPSTTMENESAVIRLAYPPDSSKKNIAVFELNNNTKKEVSIEEANKLIDKATRDENDFNFIKDVKYVTYYLPNDALKKIELINTPGMNVLTDDFYPKVQHLFSEADVILWVNNSEQILDKFNSWLIQKIHADNDKIAGFITFPDKLYRQDECTGVTDVVTQFMTNLENGRLIRVNGEIGLFIINGKFAQIANSQKSDRIAVENLEDEEWKFRLIYNYLNHGFAYSDEEGNNEILKNHKLFGIQNGEEYGLEMDFDLDRFFEYCLNHNLCVLDENKTSAFFTKEGRELVGEVSQYNAFGRFAEDYLIPRSKKSKLESVKGRLKRSLSSEDNKDNSISRLIQIKEALQKKEEKLSKEEQDRIANIKKIVVELEKKFDEECGINLPHATDNFADELLELILNKLDGEIGALDFFKEILGSLTPSFLKSDETAISRKTSQIIEESIQAILPIHLEKLAKESNQNIEIILLQLEQDYIANRKLNSTNQVPNHQGLSSNLDFSGIFLTIRKKLKPLLATIIKELLQNIAKKDLRKGANTFLKKNVIKPIVKLIRKLLQKEAKKAASKKAAQMGTKAGSGPIGWIMIAADVIMIGKDLRKMYLDMKIGLKDALKAEESFRNIFENQADMTNKFIIDAVVKDLNRSFSEEKIEINFILEGIAASEKVIEELEKFNEK